MLEGLRNLEELYVMGFFGRLSGFEQADVPLLQTFGKLRIAVMDFYDAPVRCIPVQEIQEMHMLIQQEASCAACICMGSALDRHNKTCLFLIRTWLTYCSYCCELRAVYADNPLVTLE